MIMCARMLLLAPCLLPLASSCLLILCAKTTHLAVTHLAKDKLADSADIDGMPFMLSKQWGKLNHYPSHLMTHKRQNRAVSSIY